MMPSTPDREIEMNASHALRPSLRTVDSRVATLHAGWSVAPLAFLHQDRSAVRHRRWGAGGHANEDTRSAIPRLRVVGDFVGPVANENLVSVVGEPVDGDSSSGPHYATDHRDGDLVALGTLACLISAIATIAGLAWLIGAVF
jgi:hypothetical protein